MQKGKIRLKIYGVRGSYPPTSGDISRFGVNTTCLRVDIGEHLLVVDAGTGIINLGQDLLNQLKSADNRQDVFNIHLMFTHTHLDHFMGFPYFMMNYIPKSRFHVISPKIIDYDVEEVLNMWMSPAFFPVTMEELPASFDYYDFSEHKILLFFEKHFEIVPAHAVADYQDWVCKISALRNFTHPKGGAYIYKFETPAGGKAVFATDIEGYTGGDQRLIQFAKDADLLIHDAQYSLKEYMMFQGFGHSTYEMACEVAQKAGVKQLLLTHHDPKHTDAELSELEAAAQKLFSHTQMANESMEFWI